MSATLVEVRAQPPINPEVPKVAAMAKEKAASPPKKNNREVSREKNSRISLPENRFLTSCLQKTP